MRSSPDCQQDLDAFWRSLAETDAWTRAHRNIAEPKFCYRRGSIAPPTLHSSYFAAVDSVVGLRHWEVRSLPDHPRATDGRLLAYFPDADLFDGCAAQESKGFFDAHNAPPWGTWVCMFEDPVNDPSYRRYLVAWIPNAFIELAEIGIHVNPEECIQWLSDTETLLAEIIAPVGRT